MRIIFLFIFSFLLASCQENTAFNEFSIPAPIQCSEDLKRPGISGYAKAIVEADETCQFESYNQVCQNGTWSSLPDVQLFPSCSTIEDELLSCSQAAQVGNVQTYTYRVDFPEAIECSFNVNIPEIHLYDSNGNRIENPPNYEFINTLNEYGNGPRVNRRIQARIEQNQYIQFNPEVPTNSKLCDLEFNFLTANMEYDDEILLTMNNFLLMSSINYTENSVAEEYAGKGLKFNDYGLAEYKWFGENGLFGLFYDHNTDVPYCLGKGQENSICDIPDTQKESNADVEKIISLKIPKEELIKVAVLSGVNKDQSLENKRLNFSFISTGDDDNGDCEHSAFSFEVTVKYYSPQN